MATLEIGGRAFALAPFKLGDLRKAAPHIDAINATAGALSSFEGMVNAARSIIEVLAVAVAKLDPAIDADALEDLADLGDMPALQVALKDLLEESGLAPKGEAPANSEPVAEKASKRKSGASSAS